MGRIKTGMFLTTPAEPPQTPAQSSLGTGPPPPCTRPPFNHVFEWRMCSYHKGTRAKRCVKCGANNCLKCLSGMPPEGWALCQPASVEEPELLPPLVEAPPPPRE